MQHVGTLRASRWAFSGSRSDFQFIKRAKWMICHFAFPCVVSPVPSQSTHGGHSDSFPVSRSQVSRLPTICDMASLKRSKSSISFRLL